MVISLVLCEFLWPRKSLHNAATFLLILFAGKSDNFQHLVASFFLLSLVINEQGKLWHWEMVQLRGGITELREVDGFIVKTHRLPGTSQKYICCKKKTTKNKKEIIKSRSGVNKWLLWNCAILLPVSQRCQYYKELVIVELLTCVGVLSVGWLDVFLHLLYLTESRMLH